MSKQLRDAVNYLKEAIKDPFDGFKELKNLVNSMVDDPALNNLTAPELRAFHGFRQTLNLCDHMSADSMQKHVYAHYEGGDVKQAIAKLPIYKKAKSAYDSLMGKSASNSDSEYEKARFQGK